MLPTLLREADQLFPHTGLVSFFSGALIDPGWSVIKIERFGWLQCVAFRNTDHLQGFRGYIDDLAAQNAGNHSTASRSPETASRSERTRPNPASDRAVGTFMAAEYDTFLLWCPSLVQHSDLPSVFSGTQLGRISWSYEQAYRQATDRPRHGSRGRL